MAEAIVSGIFSFHNANFPPPSHIPSVLFSSRFWHAHLNNACNRAVSPTGGTGTLDNMAGDQLAIWNQVNHASNHPLPSTHLTIFVPPALGAYILSNVKGNADTLPQLKPTPQSQPSLSPVLTVSQPFTLPLPVVFPQNEDGIMKAAREAAADGHVRLRLFHSSVSLTKVSTIESSNGHSASPCRLQPPPPPPAGSPPQLFSDRARIALKLWKVLSAWPLHNANESTHVLYNSPFLRLPHIESILDHPRLDPMSTLPPPQDSVRQWLFDGAPRIIPHRLRKLNPVPKALVDFFTDNIRLPQVFLLLRRAPDMQLPAAAVQLLRPCSSLYTPSVPLLPAPIPHI